MAKHRTEITQEMAFDLVTEHDDDRNLGVMRQDAIERATKALTDAGFNRVELMGNYARRTTLHNGYEDDSGFVSDPAVKKAMNGWRG